jgi:hypothetical protein
MSAANPAWLETIDFLASGTTPEALIAFRPSEAAQRRLEELTARQRDGTLTPEEQQELSDTVQLEHLLILAKAQARQKLRSGPAH